MIQSTFPKIEELRHPDADGLKIKASLKECKECFDDSDIKISSDILRVYNKIKDKTTVTGEWAWIHQNKRSKFLNALDDGNVEALAGLLLNMFREEFMYGVSSGDFLTVQSDEGAQNFENLILLDKDTWGEFTDQGNNNLNIINMPRVGNPFGVLQDDILISADILRHDYFSLRIKSLLELAGVQNKARILEIGGGYGGLVVQCMRRIENLQFFNCDLPETLYLAYYFLCKATNKKIVWMLEGMDEEIDSADIVLIPSYNIGSLDAKLHIIFNSNSLSEMGEQTVNEYINVLHELKPDYFFHSNSNVLLFPDSERHVEVMASKFKIDSNLYKEIYRAVDPWQGGGGRHREFLYVRI